MGHVHFILQGKGGVGKSLVSSFLAQYLRLRDNSVHCIDSDPVNHTFAGWKSLQVNVLNLMRGTNVDLRLFDALVQELLELGEAEHAVIDSGASSFIPQCSYMKEADITGMLQEAGHFVYLHTIVTGGSSALDTFAGVNALASNFPDSPLIVWKNPYFGEIATNDVPWEQSNLFQQCRASIQSLIELPVCNPATFGVDLNNLYNRKETFEDAQNNISLMIVERSRLKRFWNELQDTLDHALLGQFTLASIADESAYDEMPPEEVQPGEMQTDE